MYVNELAKISASYLEFMHRKNSSGYTALQILKNGSSREHYEGLQNSSRLLSRLGPERARLGTGTTRNEQLHREIKSWMRNIISSHRQRLESGLRVFLLSKLLSHSSACYHPTLTQASQSQILSTISGTLRQIPFFPIPVLSPFFTQSLIQRRNDLAKPVIPENTNAKLERTTKRKLEKIMWQKQENHPRFKQRTKTNVFRRPRVDNRTRSFSQLKKS